MACAIGETAGTKSARYLANFDYSRDDDSLTIPCHGTFPAASSALHHVNGRARATRAMHGRECRVAGVEGLHALAKHSHPPDIPHLYDAGMLGDECTWPDRDRPAR